MAKASKQETPADPVVADPVLDKTAVQEPPKSDTEITKEVVVFVAKKYRVKTAKHMSHAGAMHTFPAGMEMSESTHGVEGIKKLIAAGLDLEEIK